MEKVKVKDRPTLVRDMNSKAILNTEHKGLMEYKLQRDARMKDKEEKTVMKSEHEIIKQQIHNINETLNLILSRLP